MYECSSLLVDVVIFLCFGCILMLQCCTNMHIHIQTYIYPSVLCCVCKTWHKTWNYFFFSCSSSSLLAVICYWVLRWWFNVEFFFGQHQKKTLFYEKNKKIHNFHSICACVPIALENKTTIIITTITEQQQQKIVCHKCNMQVVLVALAKIEKQKNRNN